MKHNRILPFALAALFVATACQKDESLPADTSAPATALVPGDSPDFEVDEIDMGRHVGADKKITDKTDDFAPTDTIYASVETDGGAAPVQLLARWTFQDSTVVGEETQVVPAGGESVQAFHIVKAGGWPKGKYTVTLLADGKEVRKKEVTVK